jgi:hypothetical protein
MIADILIVALVLFIASIMLAIHLGRREHGRHADTHPGWDDASIAVLRGNVAGTVTLPAYAQTVPRTEAAGLPPWGAQSTLPEQRAQVLPPLPPVTISTCRAADCIARQSHPTHHHDKWLAKYLATLPLGRLSASARQPEPLPGSGIWPTPLPAAVREHLGAETVTGAMRQIFSEVTP